ncbi:MAG: long-chain fatty acid--CoA ligase, partial [Chloracidobacterium sp.]|nr:long-chain fatty acid--CoA ligase [Chloracidobacterium sp.]
KYIAPQPIENAIKRSQYINQVVVIGDGRKFPSALIVPEIDALRAYARRQGILNEESGDQTSELISLPEIIDFMEKEVEMRTTDLSQYEKIKAILLLPRELTVEGGELTPTLKVKRRVVIEKNKERIERLYAEKESK